MRILHLNSSFTSVPVLARAQRELGHTVDVAAYHVNYMGVPADHRPEVPLSITRRFFWFARLAREYDVLHFHYHSALPIGMNYVDLPLWKALGKKVVMHYRGDDVRDHPHRIPHLFADAILVSTPDLLPYESRAVWVPNPVDIERYTPNRDREERDRIVVCHAPSDRTRKGTHWLVETIWRMQARGLPIELDLVEGASHEEVLAWCARADIAVDQLVVGWYGQFAIECMALGVPTMCYIAPKHYGDLEPSALLNTSPRWLESDIEYLMWSRAARERRGEMGRWYVESTHDAKVVARLVCEAYG